MCRYWFPSEMMKMFSLWGLIEVLIAKHFKSHKCHYIVHFKMINFMLCEILFNKKIAKYVSHKSIEISVWFSSFKNIFKISLVYILQGKAAEEEIICFLGISFHLFDKHNFTQFLASVVFVVVNNQSWKV